MKYLFFSFCLFLSHVGHSQFLKGLKVGANYSRIQVNELSDGSTVSEGDAFLGYHAGILLRFHIGPLYIQPEAIFTSAGGEILVTPPSNQVVPDPYALEITYNKIDVPIMVGIRFAKTFRIQGGPVGSYFLTAEQENTATGAVLDILENYEHYTLGYQVGIGFDLGKYFIIDLRYEDNLSRYGDQVGIFKTDLRNNQILLSVGLILR